MGLRALIALALLATGCATMSELNAGPVVALPTKEDASFGGAIAAHAAIGSSSETKPSILGVDVNAKAKLTAKTQQIAFGQGFLFAGSIGAKGEGILRAGLHLAFERFDERLLLGGGPYAAVMGGVVLDEKVYYVPSRIFAPEWRRERTLLTFGPMVEIDARFSRPSAVAFLGIGVGIAWKDASTAPPPPIFPLLPQPQPSP